MSAPVETPRRVGPSSPWWYAVAVFLVLGAWMLGVAVAAGDWDAVRDARPTPSGQRIPDDAGAGRVAAYTDTVQPDREVTCVLRKGRDEPVPLHEPGADIRAIDGEQTWYLVAISDPGTDRGGENLRCTPKDGKIDSASYTWALVPDPTRANTGNGIGSIGTAVGLGLAGWTWWTRRARREDAR